MQRPTREHRPVGAVKSAGRDIVRLAELAGLFLDDWQAWFLDQAMGERADGRWAAFEVCCLVARQNGKGSIEEARQLAGLFYLREPLQVYTAHEFKTAYEHFLRITNLVESNPDFDRKVQRVRRGAGEQAIELRTGERLRFLARTTGSGRGLTGDVIYLDEAYALTPAMMGALLPTLSAVPNPQVWYMSSAPWRTSDVLHSLRKRVGGEDARLFYAEWGNEPGVDIEDVEAWYRANPALGIRIGEEFVRAELDAMRSSPDQFARERLGVPEFPDVEVPGAVDLKHWAALKDPDSSIVTNRTFALDVAPDRRFSTFGMAGRRADGLLHVETFDHRPGTRWVLDRGCEIWGRERSPIRIDRSGPAGSFIVPLRERGVEVVEVSVQEHAQACGQFIDAAVNSHLRHLGQSSLDHALRGAVLRPSGDAELWARRGVKVDISPLVAVTLALGGVPAPKSAATARIAVF